MSRRGTTAKPLPKGGQAVMAQRREPPDALDFFPTPPWATRALIEHVLGDLARGVCWEPAAGAGHMADVLAQTFTAVYASDVFDYGRGYDIAPFTAERLGLVNDLAQCPERPDWVITNPPFNEASAFALRAFREARTGVALLVRASWLEGVERYHQIFQPYPPAIVAQFVERVPMVKGRWDPDASTATAYAWVVWLKPEGPREPWMPQGTRYVWIPPGCRERLTRPDDRRRFAPETTLDLFSEEQGRAQC